MQPRQRACPCQQPRGRSQAPAGTPIFFLDRPLDAILPTDDRPLSSDRAALEKRYAERYPIYTATADAVIPVTGTPEAVAEAIRKEFSE